MKTFEKFLQGRKLMLSTEKIKIMICKKGGGREEKTRKCVWKEEELQEVREFNCLGFKLTRNGNNEKRVKE